MTATAFCVVLAVAVVSPALAQPASAPATTQPSAVPAGAQAMTAVVVKVAGNVRAASTVEAGQPPQWQPVKLGDRLAPGTQIRTALRSSLLLQFGDNAIVKIDRITSATVAQFYQTAQEQRIKLDLGYGTVRAGVAEGTLQSDMTIETPVATLTRRGTWNFGIEYEAVSGRFRIFVEERGIVDAINQVTNQRRIVLAKEYVTQAMIRWIETAKFDRQVRIQDVFGLTAGDSRFETYNGGGLGVVDPGAGADLMNVTRPGASLTAAELASQGQGAGGSRNPFVPGPITPGVLNRPEGNFGTGGAVLPSDLIKRQAPPRRDRR